MGAMPPMIVFLFPNNVVMRNILWLLALALFAFSCDEEDCNDTVAEPLNFNVYGEITVVNQAGLPVEGYPVRITFQKHWCDGDVGFAAEFSGQTDINGKWDHDIDYEFLNEKDYLTVHYQAGAGDQAIGQLDEFGYKIIRNSIGVGSIGVSFPALHTFVIFQ